MSTHNLRQELIKIELAIEKNEFDLALNLYEKINKNWEEYKKFITKEELKPLLKLTQHIDKLLLEKRKDFFACKNFFQLRKAYSRF